MMRVHVAAVGVACARGVGGASLLLGDAPLAACAPPLPQFASLLVGRAPLADAGEYVPQRKALKLMSRASQLAIAATGEALRSGPWDAREEAGLFLSVGMSGGEIRDLAGMIEASTTPEGELDLAALGARGLDKVNPLLSFHVLNNMPLCHVSITYGLGGPHAALYGEDAAAGLQAAHHAAATVGGGEGPWALAGGAESPLNTIALALQHGHRAPLAEGAASVVFAREDHAAPDPGLVVWRGLVHAGDLPSALSALRLPPRADLYCLTAGHPSPAQLPADHQPLEALLGDTGAASGALLLARGAALLGQPGGPGLALLVAPCDGAWLVAALQREES